MEVSSYLYSHGGAAVYRNWDIHTLVWSCGRDAGQREAARAKYYKFVKVEKSYILTVALVLNRDVVLR